MKDQTMDNIHHFAHEFAFEDLKDKTGVDRAHHSRPHRTRDGQNAQMKKQIADLAKRVSRLEKLLESKT